MNTEIFIAEEYLDVIMGPEEKRVAKYGHDLFNWPAYVQTGPIKDTGIVVVRPRPYFFSHCMCESSYWVRNCKGAIIGGGFIGGHRASSYEQDCEISYPKWVADVYKFCPGSNLTIDLRSLEQYEAGCCPDALKALMMV